MTSYIWKTEYEVTTNYGQSDWFDTESEAMEFASANDGLEVVRWDRYADVNHIVWAKDGNDDN